jgi:putative ABC transport system permease protein
VRYAWDALRRRPGRSAATALGVGLAIGLVVILLALSAGIQTSAGRLAGASGIDLLATSANTSLADGTFPPIAGAHGLPSAIARADPNVASASPWLVTSLVYANASLWSTVNASPSGGSVPAGWGPTSAGTVGWVPADNAGLNTPSVVVGSGFSDSQDPHFANGSYDGPMTHETELDQGLAGLLHAHVGDLVWVSATSVTGPAGLAAWYANATAFRVVGVTEPFWLLPSALLGFFHLSELQSLVGGSLAVPDPASLVLIHLNDPSNVAGDRSRIEQALPTLTVFTIGDILTVIQSSVDLYRTFGTLVGAIGLVVATLFATTILLMSVDDRSREIALLRAVGFSRARIGGFVIEEGVWLSLLGLGVGLAIGTAGAYALNAFLQHLLPGLPEGFTFVSVDLNVVGTALVGVILLGVVASLLPAARAMSFPVAAELRAP